MEGTENKKIDQNWQKVLKEQNKSDVAFKMLNDSKVIQTMNGRVCTGCSNWEICCTCNPLSNSSERKTDNN